MNNMDFSFLAGARLIGAALGLMFFYAAGAGADAPSPERFSGGSELVLTLSDQWSDVGGAHEFAAAKSGQPLSKPLGDTMKPKPVNVGCGMDMDQFAAGDNSFGSRLVGECNLNYRY